MTEHDATQMRGQGTCPICGVWFDELRDHKSDEGGSGYVLGRSLLNVLVAVLNELRKRDLE